MTEKIGRDGVSNGNCGWMPLDDDRQEVSK